MQSQFDVILKSKIDMKMHVDIKVVSNHYNVQQL